MLNTNDREPQNNKMNNMKTGGQISDHVREGFGRLSLEMGTRPNLRRREYYRKSTQDPHEVVGKRKLNGFAYESQTSKTFHSPNTNSSVPSLNAPRTSINQALLSYHRGSNVSAREKRGDKGGITQDVSRANLLLFAVN